MGYIDDYRARQGKCEYCKHYNSNGNHVCAECFGMAFVDSMDLFSFIRSKASKDNGVSVRDFEKFRKVKGLKV